ncbi:MAG: GNAT family N-acetyltransferase, partial [Clostridia bacterium]|nr:GNAT family N-acetyltransferase [Clostridia bacterium]
MTVRKADPALRNAYVEVYRNARRFMAAHGNLEQWADKDFGAEVDLDLSSGVLYEARNEAGELLGVFAFLPGPDPTYAEIEGVWLDNAPYRVL